MARPVSKLKEGATLGGLTFCALWDHVPFYQPLEVGLFEDLASSYVTQPIAFEPRPSQSTLPQPTNRVRSTEGANVGGGSSARYG
jgi:hypothetical protein